MPDECDDSLRLSRQLCFSVYATAHAFNRVYKPILEPLDLTYPQYLVMLVLWEEDGLTVKEIGRRLYLDSGTLTPVLKRLEATGYVRRTRDVSDERQVRVALTQRGREIRSRALAGRRELACASGMSEDEIQALKRDLDRLRTALRGEPDASEQDISGGDAPAPHRVVQASAPDRGCRTELGARGGAKPQ